MSPSNATPNAKASTRDQRRHPRRAEDRPGWLQWSGANFGVSMVDISDGGACLISPRPLSIGRPVKLQIGHRGGENDAVVVRCAERPDGGYNVGVQFVDDARFNTACRFSTRVFRAGG